MIYVIAPQGAEVILEGDALSELTDGMVLQPAIKLGLSEQHDLQQFVLLGFQIGQQPDRLQAFERHRLDLVQAEHDLLALAGEIQQCRGQRLEQLMLAGIGLSSTAELIGQRQQQAVRRQIGIGDIRGDETMRRRLGCCGGRRLARPDRRGNGRSLLLIDTGEKLPTQQRLAGAHFAGDLDEALAVAHRDQQGVERLLVAGAGKKIAGVGGDAERCFAQTEMGLVHAY